MAILFELSESIVKQAALIASKYPDRTLLSIIEECFNYGAKSLYTDAPKPVPPKRVYDEEKYFSTPVKEERIDSIQESIYSITEKARQDIEGINYDAEDIPESLSNPIINSDGSIEF